MRPDVAIHDARMVKEIDYLSRSTGVNNRLAEERDRYFERISIAFTIAKAAYLVMAAVYLALSAYELWPTVTKGDHRAFLWFCVYGTLVLLVPYAITHITTSVIVR